MLCGFRQVMWVVWGFSAGWGSYSHLKGSMAFQILHFAANNAVILPIYFPRLTQCWILFWASVLALPWLKLVPSASLYSLNLFCTKYLSSIFQKISDWSFDGKHATFRQFFCSTQNSLYVIYFWISHANKFYSLTKKNSTFNLFPQLIFFLFQFDVLFYQKTFFKVT